MDSLLSLRENMFLRIKDKKFTSLYRCISNENIKLDGYLYSSRYHLQSEHTYKQLMIEVKKDKKHNISILAYHVIEKIDFDISLLSTLGSEILIYNNKKDEKSSKENYYQIIQTSKQKEQYFKYIILKEELPNIGNYSQDGVGNFYSILKKISPNKFISNQEINLFWKYKNSLNEELHIEVNPSKKSIIFYENIILKRENIQLIQDNYSKDYAIYDDFKNMTYL